MQAMIQRLKSRSDSVNSSPELRDVSKYPTLQYIESAPLKAVSTEVPSLLANAEVLFRHNENDLGFALLRQALKIDSNHPETLKKLATFHQSKKKYEQAEIALEVALRSDFSFVNLVRLADVCYLQGKDEKSLRKYEEAIEVLVGDIEKSEVLFNAYKNIGNILCRMGDFQGAEENYFRACSINPASDTLMVNLGTLEFQRGDNNAALEKFRHALTLNPSNDRAWVGLAIVHERMGDFNLAIANIENAVDLAPQNRTAVHILANWSIRDNRPQVAIEALQEYLSRVEQDEEMSLVLIHLFCMTQQFDLAAIEIERVLLWNPTHEEVLKLAEEISR